jgi:hypothetical protein
MTEDRMSTPRGADLRSIGPYQVVDGPGPVVSGVAPDGRPVTLRLLPDQVGYPAEGWSRVTTALRNLRREQPNGVGAVLGADYGAGEPYIVSLADPGPTLAEQVASGGPANAQQLERLARDLAEGLIAIHRSGIPFGVLSPDVAVVAPDGLRLDATAVVGPSDPGPYAAPEQRADGPIQGAGDVYSWAAVLVFAATGQPPPDDPAGVVSTSLPPTLRPLVERSLATQPSDRPELSVVLAALSGAPAEAVPVSSLTRARPAAGPPTTARPDPAATGPAAAPPTTAPATPAWGGETATSDAPPAPATRPDIALISLSAFAPPIVYVYPAIGVFAVAAVLAAWSIVEDRAKVGRQFGAPVAALGAIIQFAAQGAGLLAVAMLVTLTSSKSPPELTLPAILSALVALHVGGRAARAYRVSHRLPRRRAGGIRATITVSAIVSLLILAVISDDPDWRPLPQNVPDGLIAIIDSCPSPVRFLCH